MASNTEELIIAVQEGASWSRRLSITVPAERVKRTRGRVAATITRGMRLPGFRKGKLPERVVEQRFGPEIDQETIDRVIQEAYREALESQGIIPISQGKVDDVKYDRNAEMTFEVEVEVRPEIELERLNGFTARRPAEEVTEADVDSVLERLREERGEWEPIEEGGRPGLGEEQAIPDVEAAIATLTPGEEAEFTVTFPEDFPNEERRGQSQKLRIRMDQASHKVLPEIDDDLAKKVGDFENLDALRERILSDLKADAATRAESEVRRQLIDQILGANPFEVPKSMVERYLDYMLGEPDDEEGRRKRKERTPEEEARFQELREGLRPQAEWGLKRTLVIERISEKEGFAATQDEVDAKVEALAAEHDRTPSEVWIQLERSGQLEHMEREITEEKVFDFLKSQNTVE
jgi:trigger factor